MQGLLVAILCVLSVNTIVVLSLVGHVSSIAKDIKELRENNIIKMERGRGR